LHKDIYRRHGPQRRQLRIRADATSTLFEGDDAEEAIYFREASSDGEAQGPWVQSWVVVVCGVWGFSASRYQGLSTYATLQTLILTSIKISEAAEHTS
jgi:hypothetical protein